MSGTQVFLAEPTLGASEEAPCGKVEAVGAHRPGRPTRFLTDLTLGASEEAPCGKVEAVGPMGLVGRLAHGANRPQLQGVGLVWASSCPKVVA
jgi:hypothetical protein